MCGNIDYFLYLLMNEISKQNYTDYTYVYTIFILEPALEIKTAFLIWRNKFITRNGERKN